jgi:hypothetical protein
MNCAEFSRYYTDFRDGNDPDLAARMRAHVEGCRRCGTHHRALLIGVEALQYGEIEPSEGMYHSLSARFKTRPIR